MFARFASLALLLLAAACAGVPPVAEAPPPRPTVLLVSIDGFHPDYLDRGLTPTLSRLAAEGVRGAMRPSFPTKTFPNHYSLVTGLVPDRHGVINNTMEDPAIPGVTFRLSDKAAVADRRWWDQGEPIWVTAENAGLSTAIMFWPGSEADIRGVRPDRFVPFDQAVTGDARVDQVLAWLDAAERPDFLALYFDIVDTAGHESGPDSPELNAAVASVDASMARLVEGLRAQGLDDEVAIIVVADHGMAATSADRVIRLGPVASGPAARIIFFGAMAGIEPVGDDTALAAELLAPNDHMDCWRREDIPARFAFGRNPRTPRFFCLAETGWEILTPTARARSGGDHGFDHQAPEMQAIFIAHGPGIERGASVPVFDNVDIHPLLGRLLGVAVPAGDGDAALADQVLAEP